MQPKISPKSRLVNSFFRFYDFRARKKTKRPAHKQAPRQTTSASPVFFAYIYDKLLLQMQEAYSHG
jgi:hypothetical protein